MRGMPSELPELEDTNSRLTSRWRECGHSVRAQVMMLPNDPHQMG